jgi:membrane protease YdiL (CAAX protease family)
MDNKQQSPAFGVILLSQSLIVAAGGLFLWALDVRLPNANIDLLRAIAAGVLLAIATFLIFVLVYRFGGTFARSLLNDLNRVSWIFNGYSWIHISCVALLAGVGEELLFRGFLQTWLDRHLSIVWAILFSSVIFGLLHYLSHAYFICTILMSIALGVGYYLSGSLLMVMVWHGVYDFIALVVLVKFPHIIDIASRKKNDV